MAFNKVVLLGRLTRDIEVRYTQTGFSIGKSAIVTNRKTRLASGEMREESMFIDITFFGKSAETARQYLHKGKRVLIEGRLSFEQWIDQSGNKRSKHSIIVESFNFIDFDNQNTNPNYNMNQGYNPNYNPNYDQTPNYNQSHVTPGYQPAQQSIEKKPQPNQNQGGGDSIPEIDINEDQVPF